MDTYFICMRVFHLFECNFKYLAALQNKIKLKKKVFELFNEPNDWNGGETAQVPSNYFACYLASIYKQKINYKWNDIELISGPLFSFDQNTASSYLYQTYINGINHWGWEGIYFYFYFYFYFLYGVCVCVS